MTFVRSAWATGAELTLVGLIVCYGSFAVFNLVLLLLLSSQSLWMRDLAWSDLGLRRPVAVLRTLTCALAASVGLLIAIKVAIVPTAVFVTGERVDLSALGEPGDTGAFIVRLAQALTLAAFGEEMVFRGYLIQRITDIAGDTGIGRAAAVVVSSSLFGLAHSYQGWAGVVATALIGIALAILFLWSCKNLWVVIFCHAIVGPSSDFHRHFRRAPSEGFRIADR